MSTILIGYRGSGKTTIGQKLADHLWQKFADTDAMIIERSAKSIAEIFADGGETKFRDLEAAAVADAMKLSDHVIALGGGAVLREENRKIIRESAHRVIYLRCEAEELHRRIHADPATASNRPNLTHLGGGIDEIRKVLAEREPIYREMMHAELEVTNLDPADAMVYIVRLL